MATAKKVLAIVRESTTRQDSKSQERELTEFIKSRGYKEEEIEYIVATGASAHQANEAYLNYLQEIKEKTQGENGIKTVFIWHLNRLGRIKKYLTDMEHYFVNNGIQMYVKLGFDMPLLGEDGKETIGASIAFSVYAALVEVETQEMFEKMKRGKDENKRKGKYNGGKIKIGYRLTPDNYYTIDETTSEYVRDIFNMYVEGSSCAEIYRKYRDIGLFFDHRWKQMAYKCVTRMLKDRAYSEGDNYYTPFISKEIQDKAISMLERYRNRKRTSNIYLGSSIIKEKTTGVCFLPSRGTLVYTTSLLKDLPKHNLNINAIDFLIWEQAKMLYVFYEDRHKDETVKEFEKRIKTNKKRIGVIAEGLADYERQLENAIMQNIKYPKIFTQSKLDAFASETEKAMKKLQDEKNQLEADNTRMSEYLKDNDTEGHYKVDLLPNSDFYTTMSDEEKKKLVDTVIERVEVLKVEDKHFEITVIPRFYHVLGKWDYKLSGHKIFLSHDYKGKTYDYTKEIMKPENRRFKRVDYAKEREERERKAV